MDIFVFQINKSRDVKKQAGLSLDKLENQEIDFSIYDTVWEGWVDSNDLDEIWCIFNLSSWGLVPPKYDGKDMKTSDIVCTVSDDGMKLYYCDTHNFKEIKLKKKDLKLVGIPVLPIIPELTEDEIKHGFAYGC